MVARGFFHTFVPPHVLDSLARTGIETVRLSIEQSEQERSKRSTRIADITMMAMPGAAGPGEREIYDCQHKWMKRVKLARGEGDPVVADEAVNDAYDHSGATRDFLKKVLGRDSLDNGGMKLIVNVNYGVKYMNAFWDGDEATFGDGDGVIFSDFSKSLDVLAHELGHGVVQFTANFEYYSQSGALHEHFADVFGSAITQYKEKQSAGKADWLIGDEIMGPDLFGEAIRSMKAPGTAYDNPKMGKDPQPDHMKDYYNGPGDNRGVHINSGIPNKAFYIAAMDMGTDKAVLIWYSALQTLWRTAKFNDAVSQIVEAARLLTKAKKVPIGSTQTVRAAFKEVGLPT